MLARIVIQNPNNRPEFSRLDNIDHHLGMAASPENKDTPFNSHMNFQVDETLRGDMTSLPSAFTRNNSAAIPMSCPSELPGSQVPRLLRFVAIIFPKYSIMWRPT
jgi:hypothetical protein